MNPAIINQEEINPAKTNQEMSQAPSMELQLRVDVDDPQSPLEFYMKDEEGKMLFDASFEEGYTAEELKVLLYACQQTTMALYEVEWCSRRHGNNLRVHGDHVTFTMAKGGDGWRGGEMSISVPKAVCVSAFEKAVAVRSHQTAGSEAPNMKPRVDIAFKRTVAVRGPVASEAPSMELQLGVHAVDYPYALLQFYMKNEEGEMIVDASFERGDTSEIWGQLLYACQHQTITSFEWAPTKNGASIRAHGDHVTFTMAKDGGKSSISVPKAVCVGAFEKAIAATRRQAPVSEV